MNEQDPWSPPQKDELAQLKVQNKAQQEEIAALKQEKQDQKKQSRARTRKRLGWLALFTARFWLGEDLKSSIAAAFDQFPKLTKQTKVDVTVALIKRFSRVGLAGLLLTLLPLGFLAYQSWLLSNQNGLLRAQNDKIERQNYRLDQQTNLQEADRRSSYVFLMNNILDEMNKELALQEGKAGKTLSKPLLARIEALAAGLRPYRYLENDKLIDSPLSPERGQLFLNLAKAGLDTATLDYIFENIDFSYADLSGLNFDNLYLKGVSMNQSKANNQTSFINADLSKANIINSSLDWAHLNGAKLVEADLSWSSLSYSRLNGANLSKAILIGNELGSAQLNGANLEFADLEWAELSGAEAIGANLKFANLRLIKAIGTDLSLCDLSRANLSVADLRNAMIRGANLTGALLHGADLHGTNFRWAGKIATKNLTQFQIDRTLLSTETKLPLGFDLKLSEREKLNDSIYLQVGLSRAKLDSAMNISL